MNGRYDNLFETLEPPDGGLQGLRARIAREPRRRVRVRVMQSAAATACLLLVAVSSALVVLRREPVADRPKFRMARMRFGMDPAPREPVVVPRNRRQVLAVERVPLPTAEVVFYRVGFAGGRTTNGSAEAE